MKDKQIDIRSASFRAVHSTPGHVTYGVWVNGGKCGDLVVRQEERVAFEQMMQRGGFAPGYIPVNPEAFGKLNVSNPNFLSEELASFQASQKR